MATSRVIDVFSPSTAAEVRAAVAWSAREVAQPEPAPLGPQAYKLGAAVLVEHRPGVTLRGHVAAFLREPTQTLIVVQTHTGPRELIKAPPWRIRRAGPAPLEQA